MMTSVLIATGLLALAVVAYRALKARRHAPPVRIKFGHAFPHPNDTAAGDPVEEAAEILLGRRELGPRAPMEAAVISVAETLLGGIAPSRRPVYAYLGCLHPKLGRVGLIIGHGWFWRDAHGTSRCDTGGLAGCRGGFRCLTASQAETAVRELSYEPHAPWEAMFDDEVRDAYSRDWRKYLRGETPDPSALDAIRRKCIETVLSNGDEPDRRLWTWEVRGFATVTSQDVDVVVLAPEAFKEINARFAGEAPPTTVQILAGSVTAAGVYFMEERVVDAFMGLAT